MENKRKQILYAWSSLRQHFASRRNLSEIAKTLTVVIPLTLLVWVFAERAQVQPGSVRPLIAITIAQPSALTATVIDPANSPIEIDVSGPRVQVDQFRKDVEQRSMNGRLLLTLPSSFTHVGEQGVDLMQLLNTDASMNGSGVQITAVSPAFIRVAVDRLVTRPIGLNVPAASQLTLQHVVFDPPTVKVTGPQADIDRLLNSDSPKLNVDISNLIDASTAQGSKPIEVAVIPPANSRINVSPSKVKMTYEVGSREIDYAISSVNIVVERPIALEGRFRVKPKGIPVIRNVTVHGPVDQVTKLEGDNPTARLTAVLKITTDDAGKTDLNRAVDWDNLPPGVTVTGGPYTVDFDVIDTSGG